MIKKKHKKRNVLIIITCVLLLLATTWFIFRSFASVVCSAWSDPEDECYSESEKVFSAMSLSFLVYGCETCQTPSGTVSEILDTESMGIIIENADISRTDQADPSTALIDSTTFIRQTVGHYRFITDLKDNKSSFYGAAFADDDTKTVWISYSGSVDFTDALQSLSLVIDPRLSGQEKRAFELYEAVLQTEEIQNGYSLILTGHSLGGALASMVSYMSGAEALTISGADGLALSKIKSIEPGRSDTCHITNYLTSPEGFGFSLKDCIQRMMFWGDYSDIICHKYKDNGMVDNSHCVFGFVKFENGDCERPRLPKEESYER